MKSVIRMIKSFRGDVVAAPLPPRVGPPPKPSPRIVEHSGWSPNNATTIVPFNAVNAVVLQALTQAHNDYSTTCNAHIVRTQPADRHSALDVQWRRPQSSRHD